MKLVKHTEPTFIFIADEPYQVLSLLMSEIWEQVHDETTGPHMPPLNEYFNKLSTTDQIDELLHTPAGQDYSVDGIDFIDFLVEERAYQAFLHNMRGKDINELLENIHPQQYVAEAFLWNDTIEGSQYWAEVNDLWLVEAGFA